MAAIILPAILLLVSQCSETFKVNRVIDGDTIVVTKGMTTEKVRLKGVDAPEIPHPSFGNYRDDPFGYEAKQCLADLLAGHDVRLVFATPGGAPERDKYGRLLAYVYVGDRLVNAELIELGCARAMRSFLHPERERFIMLEQKARRNGAGLWPKDFQRRPDDPGR